MNVKFTDEDAKILWDDFCTLMSFKAIISTLNDDELKKVKDNFKNPKFVMYLMPVMIFAEVTYRMLGTFMVNLKKIKEEMLKWEQNT